MRIWDAGLQYLRYLKSDGHQGRRPKEEILREISLLHVIVEYVKVEGFEDNFYAVSDTCEREEQLHPLDGRANCKANHYFSPSRESKGQVLGFDLRVFGLAKRLVNKGLDIS